MEQNITDYSFADLLPVDNNGYYGEFGGAFVPDELKAHLDKVGKAFREAVADPSFLAEFNQLMRDYLGRPTPLYHAPGLSRRYGAKIYLKREDLNHTGAHKINNAIGLGLLARRMGKKRIIAETGAGQHGVAAATVAALLGLQCTVYMGAADMERQRPNVQRMRMLGADVRPATAGNSTTLNPVRFSDLFIDMQNESEVSASCFQFAYEGNCINLQSTPSKSSDRLSPISSYSRIFKERSKELALKSNVLYGNKCKTRQMLQKRNGKAK